MVIGLPEEPELDVADSCESAGDEVESGEVREEGEVRATMSEGDVRAASTGRATR